MTYLGKAFHLKKKTKTFRWPSCKRFVSRTSNLVCLSFSSLCGMENHRGRIMLQRNFLCILLCLVSGQMTRVGASFQLWNFVTHISPSLLPRFLGFHPNFQTFSLYNCLVCLVHHHTSCLAPIPQVPNMADPPQIFLNESRSQSRGKEIIHSHGNVHYCEIIYFTSRFYYE